MDGIYLETVSGAKIRPATKSAILQTVKERPERVFIEVTEVGHEQCLNLTQAPEGTYHFVGPDPYRDRRFYGMIKITHRNNQRKVTAR